MFGLYSERDSLFKHTEKSPLTEDDKSRFERLRYFDYDERWAVEATLFFDQDTAAFDMATTTARKVRYRKWARAEFTFKGMDFEVTLYQNLQLLNDPEYHDYLFIPFTDLTNGDITYAGGRYVEARKSNDHQSQIIIDFNKAYNPYCAYNSRYSCPIPPQENHLKVGVEAGEKAFRK